MNTMLAATAAGAVLATACLLGSTTRADAAPVCQFGFATEQQTSWLLKCRKVVPIAQKGVALTEANNATCKTDRYWNFGPSVTASNLAGNLMVVVRYTCGHVEG